MTAPRRQKRKPTIEQRLEAITQTMELVAGMQLATERQLDRLAGEVGNLAGLSRRVLTNHERRINKLEGGRR